MQHAILQPVVALLIWTALMWLWMYATRIPAITKAKVDFNVVKTGEQLRRVLPERVSWIADNYNHLHEQPVLFYTVCLVLAIVGGEQAGHGINVTLAWTYVGLRIVHSLVQTLVNNINLRFFVFVLASIALFALITHAAMTVF